MKNILRYIYIILISLISVTGLFVVLNIFITGDFIKLQLMKKFEIDIVLQNNLSFQTESVISEIKHKIEQNKNFLLQEIVMLSKEDIWEIIEKNEDTREFLVPLTRNPFSDVIKVRFKDIKFFDRQNFLHIISEMKNENYVKEIFYDKNLVRYLSLISKMLKYTEKIKYIFAGIIICCIFLGFGTMKFDLYKSLIFFVIYNIMLWTSLSIWKKMSLGIKYENIFWFIIFFIFGIVLVNYEYSKDM